MTSLVLFVMSMVTAVVVGTPWGIYVTRRYRRWSLSQDAGVALATIPPFLLSIAFSVASVLCK